MSNSTPHIQLQKGDIHILIIGGGNGGNDLLNLFYHYNDWLYIDGIVDLDEQAVGIQHAHSLGIPTYTDALQTIESFTGDIIIDVTANAKLRQKLIQTKLERENLEVISGKSSRLLFDLVNQEHKQQQTIKDKDLHLKLLNAMLDLSLKLEEHKDTADVIKHASKGIHQGLQARKALTMVIKGMDSECFGILDKPIPSPVPQDFILHLQQYFTSREHKGKAFVSLSPALYIPFVDETFNLAIPLFDQHALIAVIFVEHHKALDVNTRMLLEVTSSHLHLAIQAKKHHQALEYQAIRDPLTGIYNRRHFATRLEEEFNRLERGQQGSLSCMFFDIDLFKLINDQYGHEVGDILLVRIAEHIHQHLRAYDIVARYGGDEFIALLPGELGKSLPLENIACRILESVKQIKIKGYEDIHVSLSIGVACVLPTTITNSQELITLADDALYHAKNAGRGCVRLKEVLENSYIKETTVHAASTES